MCGSGGANISKGKLGDFEKIWERFMDFFFHLIYLAKML